MEKRSLSCNIFYLIMGMQILISFIWIVYNINVIPIFGDSTEYINLSETLIVDEYREIGYPLLLHIFKIISNYIHVPFHILTYIFQSTLSFVCVLYTIRTISNDYSDWKSWKKDVFFSFFIMSVPLITGFNFTILTDSLALSVLLLYVSSIVRFMREEKYGKYLILVGISLIASGVIRVDRLYIIVIFDLLYIVYSLVNKYNRKKVIAMVIATLLCVMIVIGINSITQKPGYYGRTSFTFTSMIFNRACWPEFEENYKYFPKEITDIISVDDAKTVAEHNNNVSYYLLPILETEFGKENLDKIMWKMIVSTLKNNPIKTFVAYIEDIVTFCMFPFSSITARLNITEAASEWNVHCLSSKTPILTNLYCVYYYILMILGAVVCMVNIFINKVKYSYRMYLPYFVTSLIVAFMFSSVASAPPNDRYGLIFYFLWTVVIFRIVTHQSMRK